MTPPYLLKTYLQVRFPLARTQQVSHIQTDTMVSLNAVSILAALLTVSSAYLVDPPTTAPSNTIADCSNWAIVTSADTCQSLADANFITLAQFNTYNPSVGSKCALIIGDSYCVEENFGIPPVSTSSTSVISTSTGNGINTPTPIQTGIVSNCNKLYVVKSGDQWVQETASNGKASLTTTRDVQTLLRPMISLLQTSMLGTLLLEVIATFSSGPTTFVWGLLEAPPSPRPPSLQMAVRGLSFIPSFLNSYVPSMRAIRVLSKF